MLKNNGFHNRHSPFARQTAFSPLSLFSGGAPGAWYDPSDLTTLFQDSAGTTPVTAVEQPVGLMLDKSQGLVLGPELVVNGAGTNTAGWTTPFGGTLVSSGGVFVLTSASGSATNTIMQRTFPSEVGKSYTLSVNIRSVSGDVVLANAQEASGGFATKATTTNYLGNTFATRQIIFTASTASTFVNVKLVANADGDSLEVRNISVKELPGNHAFQATSASRPVLSARVNKLLATAALATQSVTTRATAHTLRFEGAGSVTLTGTAIGVYTAGTHSITTTAGTLTLTVLGSVTSADLRETNDGVGVPAYQAVVTSTNYATTGFLPYLKFDGVDDSLSTNSISFTSTDKMSVFAGVRKLSDANAYGIVVELSPSTITNNGAFAITQTSTLPPLNGQNWAFFIRGTANTGYAAVPYIAPITNVLTMLTDIAGASRATEITPRINGATPTLVDQDAANAGTGNFGNYPLYIGRRNNASLPFNGQLYSMIIVGKAVTAGELSSTETYVNQKTGAY